MVGRQEEGEEEDWRRMTRERREGRRVIASHLGSGYRTLPSKVH